MNTNATNNGWSREYIKAELRHRGYSLSALDRQHGHCIGYFSQALRQPLRNAEKIIADILGVHPSEIWPARYGSDGRPIQGRFLPERDNVAKEVARQASNPSQGTRGLS